jgi:hypothetical protein
VTVRLRLRIPRGEGTGLFHGEIQRLTSFADALTAAIRAHGDFVLGQPQPMRFARRVDLGEQVDHVLTGRHTLIYELPNGKQYRVMVEPVPETHR